MQTQDKVQKITPNKMQQECIENIKGRYLVLAGPGTGKTFTLIQRINNMLQKGINPEKILCLTFSDAAANEMKTRLAKSLNKLDSGVDIYTFHSFCSEIISQYPEDLDLSNDLKLITPASTIRLMKECIEEINPIYYRTKRNDPYALMDSITNGISEIQKYRLNKEQYFEAIEKNPNWIPKIALLEKEIEDLKNKNKDTSKKILALEEHKEKIEKTKELWKFYELYKTKMGQERYIDFCDMICLVLDKFQQSPSFLDKVANKYEYILVDEYQDTNKAQNEIIFNLVNALKSQNVFVVGDDDQIIYTFQGAKMDTMEQFLKHFPDTKVICLKENMRSTQNILDAARLVALQDSKRLEINPDFKQYEIDKNIIAKNEKLYSKNKPVKCTKYFDLNQERLSIVDEIEALINSSDCPLDEKGNKDLSQIAILSRTHKELSEFAQIFKNRNIPCDCKTSKSIFEIKSSIVLYYYLQMLNNPEINSDKILKLLLMEPFKINPLDYIKIYEKSSKNISFIDSIREIEDFSDKEKMNNFIKTFDYLMNYQTDETLKNIILETGSKTGIFNYYLNCEINKRENIEGIKRIIDEAIDFSDTNKKCFLNDFVEYLNLSYEKNLDISTQKAPVNENAIQLCTYYASKGCEYEYVYMPNMMKHNWETDGKTFKINVPVGLDEYKTEDELSDMRISDRIKLIYVGMTRAKHTLNLSYVENVNAKAKPISMFIEKIQSGLKMIDNSKYTNEEYLSDCTKSIIKKDYDYKRDFCSLVETKLKDRSFSPTAINEYINCPRQYFYNYILDLASKYTPADAANFGTAVHNTLDKATKIALETSNYPKKEHIVNDFYKEFDNLNFSSIEQRKILKELGEKTFDKFYPHFVNIPISSIKASEYKLRYDALKYQFFGKIDRIDKNSDGTFTIYDYKTGKAKTAKNISPEGSHENYYNQIALYKYFYEKENNVKIKEVCFVFVEEPENNLYLKLTDEDCAKVVEKFENAIESIRACNFEPKYDKDACQYCPYKIFCSMNII